MIDLGFNSAKMVCYRVDHENSYTAYQHEGDKVMLGEGLSETGFLGKEPTQRTIKTLKLFRDIINFDAIKHVLPIATSAVREAANRTEFLQEVYQETGFRFKVLSAKEEALYSYAGAIRSTGYPSALFFDLGGGSLEIIYAERFKIKKIMSLPLGALRLTQIYGRRDGTFTHKNYNRMRKRILELVPDKKELDMSDDTVLVGVGGTLRAIARYNQELTQYPLDKIHNYAMAYDSVESISRRLHRMHPDNIAEIDAIGSSRASTATAGALVVCMLMRKLECQKIVVSAQGLREGTLLTFLEDAKAYQSGNVTQQQIENFVSIDSDSRSFERRHHVLKELNSLKLVDEREVRVADQALERISNIESLTNLQIVFDAIIDEDSRLDHKEQLMLALSIVRTRNKKKTERLMKRYRQILSNSKQSIARISSLVTFLNILEKTNARMRLTRTGKKVEIKILSSKIKIPAVLLQNALQDIEETFDVSVDCSVHGLQEGTQSTQLIKLREV